MERTVEGKTIALDTIESRRSTIDLIKIKDFGCKLKTFL